jgi:plasmid stabilization system protein ParE
VSLTVVLAEDAVRDIEAATTWYATSGSVAIAARFLVALDAVLTRLEQFPAMHPEVAPSVRRALTTPFPYLLLYEIGEREVVVHRCMHAHRDPIRWR